LRQIEAEDKLATHSEEHSTALDGVAAHFNLKEAFETCKSLKTTRLSTRVSTRRAKRDLKHTIEGDHFEHDFTTHNGTPSHLECPFAKLTNGNPPNTTTDPIAAEFHNADGSVGSGTAYAQQNPNKCPIRYLDQHSPAEVAKYFENHKHEIPRSHAVCISRYQQNDAKIRQLDAKYGNLQNMIQSLGVKHQQYLPSKDGREYDAQRPGSRSSQRAADVVVEKWAEDVSQKSNGVSAPPPRQPMENNIEEDRRGARTQHLETSLREIRVGESPTRPWGISVPVAQEAAASAIPSDRGIEPLDLDRVEGGNAAPAREQEVQEVKRCPFGHGAGKNEGADILQTSKEEAVTQAVQGKDQASRPQMVFNGPVFFGYSPEQATAMMQSGAFDSCGKT
jgi:hypothetical protein